MAALLPDLPQVSPPPRSSRSWEMKPAQRQTAVPLKVVVPAAARQGTGQQSLNASIYLLGQKAGSYRMRKASQQPPKMALLVLQALPHTILWLSSMAPMLQTQERSQNQPPAQLSPDTASGIDLLGGAGRARFAYLDSKVYTHTVKSSEISA